jgi:hypothetical protein
MSETVEKATGSSVATPRSACEDNHSREVRPVEGPCPLCGAPQEFFSDELRTAETLRCQDCGERFETSAFAKTAKKT